MAIFEINGRRVLFIRIPKCGGTSISDFLDGHTHRRFDKKISLYGRPIRPRHLHAAVLEQIYFGGMFDYVFTVARNPFSRIISEYSYQTRKAGPRWQRLIGFDGWLRLSLTRAREIRRIAKIISDRKAIFRHSNARYIELRTVWTPCPDRLRKKWV